MTNLHFVCSEVGPTMLVLGDLTVCAKLQGLFHLPGLLLLQEEKLILQEKQ